MKKKFAKRFLSWVMAAAMVISMLPLSAMAAAPGDAVAQIGDTPYSTLEAALDAATASEENSVTIKMLDNCTITKSITIPEGKTFTLEAEPDANVTITDNGRYGMTLNGSFAMENITFITNGRIALNADQYGNPSGRKITFRNVTLKMDSGNYAFSGGGYYSAAIFADSPALFVFDNCDVEIKNYYVDNFGGAAIRWNGKLGDTGYGVEIINGTEFTSSGCYSGFTGTLDLLVDSSTLNVVDHAGYGSNGTYYTIRNNSKVLFDGNGAWGISAYTIDMTGNSTLTATNNAYSGVWVRILNVDKTCTLDVENNGYAGDWDLNKVTAVSTGATSSAGITFWGNTTPSTIENGANVTIKNNAGSGIAGLQGISNLTIGSATIVNNGTNSDGTSALYGGGIFTVGTIKLGPDVVIYNNHATNAGDDIYFMPNATTRTLEFGKVGSDWVLDDCEHLIDGWYDDAESTRWKAHAETEEGNHIDEFTTFDESTGLATITGTTDTLALKAAHGADAKDKTSYPGLTKDVSDLNDETNWQEDKAVDVAAGNTVKFQLTSNVPDDLRNYLKPEDVYPPVIEGEPEGTPAPGVPVDENRGSYTLTFHDVMDTEHKMLVDPENFVVTVGGETENGTELPVIDLTEMNLSEDMYNITQNPGDGCTFEVTLDLAKLYEMGKEEGINVDAYIDNAAPITVTYQATLSEDAVSGQFENKAWVTAPNWKTSEDVVYVNTYAINIYKYKQGESETGLSGAVFELKLGDKVIKNDITSGENGHVVVGGLDKGNYTLTETKAPEGYVCSETPLEIKVPDNATNYVVNVSFANSLIPHTGGMGTTLFSIVGGALIVTAGVVFFVSRRKKSHTA